MPFGRDTMVEKDLERIRRANLPPEKLAALEAQEAEDRQRFERDRPGFMDVFAMTIAMLSLVGPYVLVFVGLLLSFLLIFR